jgi:hypothetical protein
MSHDLFVVFDSSPISGGAMLYLGWAVAIVFFLLLSIFKKKKKKTLN